MQRTNLKLFRIKHKLTQEAIADKIPCARATYQAIECGRRDGRQTFWNDLQKAFHIPKSEMFELMQTDDYEEDSNEAKNNH